MQYQLRQKMLSFGDDFQINDGNGKPCFFVDGKVFTIGDKLSFQDLDGNELLKIEQKLVAAGETYLLLKADKQVGLVRKRILTLLGTKFEIEDDKAGKLEVEGDFFELEYKIRRSGRDIAQISKRFFSMSDTYGVEIDDSEPDHVFILACAVVIDLCCHDD